MKGTSKACAACQLYAEGRCKGMAIYTMCNSRRKIDDNTAPWIYTDFAESYAASQGLAPIKAGTTAMLNGEPLEDADVAKVWKKLGIIANR